MIKDITFTNYKNLWSSTVYYKNYSHSVVFNNVSYIVDKHLTNLEKLGLKNIDYETFFSVTESLEEEFEKMKICKENITKKTMLKYIFLRRKFNQKLKSFQELNKDLIKPLLQNI